MTAKAIFNAWLPLARSMMYMIVKQIQPPHLAQKARLRGLFPDFYEKDLKDSEFHRRLKGAMETADKDSDFVVCGGGGGGGRQSVGSLGRAALGGLEGGYCACEGCSYVDQRMWHCGAESL